MNQYYAKRTKWKGQLMSDDGIKKYAGIWVDKLFQVSLKAFQEKPTDYLLDLWLDFPWHTPDMRAVICHIAQDEELRWKVHAFDVLYLSERVVEWDISNGERFSYRYSLKQDILIHACGFAHGWTENEYTYDVREELRYG